jgi:TFIIF-interacting CTD phosphatase-like protein
MKDIVIVDNSILSFAFQLENGIPIKAFMRQEEDEELLFMVSFLEEMFSYLDPREHLKKTFCLRELMHKYCV